MRLREPFSGYKLSCGHYLFHIAYLVGSLSLPLSFEDALGRLEGPREQDEAQFLLKWLRIAHLVVPLLQVSQEVLGHCGFFTISKCLHIVSIF